MDKMSGMRRHLPSTQALACFEAAARHESYTRAAQELALTQSAVSRQILALEDQLGVQLFRRTRHGVVLTPAGRHYARQVARWLQALEQGTLDVMAHQGQGGAISLAAVATFATRWLIPRLPQLAARHPEIVVHIETQTRPFLFTDTGFDAALYAGTPEQVANWPGVTVEKKEGKLKGEKDVIIQDLPGIYSLSPYTLEEVVSRTYLVKEKPDAILNIIDGTNIERNLYLTTQLIELGIPVVMAVNMIDLVRKNGDKIDLKKLSSELGCQAVEISALKGEGTEAAAKAAVAAAQKQKAGELPHVFTGSVEHAIAHIEESIQGKVDDRFLRWYAVKLFERDDKVMEELKLDKALVDHIDEHIADCEKEMDDDAESIITNQRYSYINGVVDKAVKKKARVEHLTVSDKIDQIVTNRVLALPIFALVMFLMYSLSMGTSIADGGWAIGTFATDWTNDVLFGEIVPNALGGFLESIGVAGWLYGLIMDGIVAGVGAVLGFVPQMLVLFFLLSILEDVGYMSRVAFIMDRIFRKFGLSGKSFIPMLVGTGCGVPGVMASRTIENERDRRMTIMTTCFIPCGAKMPIIGLIAGALFGGSSLVAVSAYFIGMAAIICSGIILKKTKLFAGDPAPFVMELPAYHVPAWGNVFRATWERGWSFIKRAGSVILAGYRCAVVPAGLRLRERCLRHGRGSGQLRPGCHRHQDRMDLRSSGLRQLASNRRFRLRPDRKGERGWYLRCPVSLRRRAV